jgi:DNA-binding MarR family transcriptional regulator
MRSTSDGVDEGVEEAFQQGLLALFRLHGNVLHAADEMSRDLGLSGARWQVLNVLARQPRTVSQVARRLRLRRQSVQRTVDVLRRDGLVSVVDNPEDRRAGLAVLTDRGQDAARRLRASEQAWLALCLDGVDQRWLEQLTDALEELSTRVERGTAAVKGDAPEERAASSAARLVAARHMGSPEEEEA